MSLFFLSDGTSYDIGAKINEGGEGEIFEIRGRSQYCVKIYKTYRQDQFAKVKFMVNHPLKIPAEYKQGINLAWPIDVIYDKNRNFVGFVMPRFSLGKFISVKSFFHYDSDSRQGNEFSWKKNLEIALYIAFIVDFLHKMGYCIGDLNSENIWVSKKDGSIAFLDCDSYQVTDTMTGKTYYCPVGSADYTAPEHLGKKNWMKIDRYHSDLFALGILIFEILMEGAKPYSARGPGIADVGGAHSDKIEKGLFPYGNYHASVLPPVGNLPWEMLSLELQSLFARCFVTGHKNPQARPEASEWARTLYSHLNKLEQCAFNQNHIYLKHCKSCPWCDALKYDKINYYPGQPPSKRLNLTAAPIKTPNRHSIKKISPKLNQYIPPVSPKSRPPTQSSASSENELTPRFIIGSTSVVACIIIFLFFILPGFSNTPENSTIQTQIPIQETRAGVVDPLVPIPTDEVPDFKQVWVQIQRDPSNKNINIQLAAARNIGIISKMEVRVTTPSGRIYSEQKTINSEQAEITVKDLEDHDRVEVFITFADGTRYKVKDEILSIRQYN